MLVIYKISMHIGHNLNEAGEYTGSDAAEKQLWGKEQEASR